MATWTLGRPLHSARGSGQAGLVSGALAADRRAAEGWACPGQRVLAWVGASWRAALHPGEEGPQPAKASRAGSSCGPHRCPETRGPSTSLTTTPPHRWKGLTAPPEMSPGRTPRRPDPSLQKGVQLLPCRPPWTHSLRSARALARRATCGSSGSSGSTPPPHLRRGRRTGGSEHVPGGRSSRAPASAR